MAPSWGGQQRRNTSAVLTENQTADSTPECGRRDGSLALQVSFLLLSKHCKSVLKREFPYLNQFVVPMAPLPAVCPGLCLSQVKKLLPLWTAFSKGSPVALLAFAPSQITAISFEGIKPIYAGCSCSRWDLSTIPRQEPAA